jgi:hypothetical protein
LRISGVTEGSRVLCLQKEIQILRSFLRAKTVAVAQW